MTETDRRKERLRKALINLRVEREIYLRVFNNPTPKIPNPLSGEVVINAAAKHVLKAEINYRYTLRFEDLTFCPRCHTQGIQSPDEKDGDSDYIPIFTIQDDCDSQYYNQYLCEQCLAEDDQILANRGGQS